MKRVVYLGVSLLVFGVVAFGLYFNPDVAAAVKKQLWGSDPDLPDFAQFKVNKEEFMMRREENIGAKRGIFKGVTFDPQDRLNALRQLEEKQTELLRVNAPQATWTEIGPAPIPLGQTDTTRVDVSGRTTAIAVHPTDPNIVYVGTAQGGVYRTTDGGTNWTPLMDGAQSLAIGAIAISSSDPETIWVGTGEPNLAVDAFHGVGIYRITNASTTATLAGPFGGAQFNGRAIGRILVHPTDPNIIFACSTRGFAGFFQSGATPGFTPLGVYRSNDAASATPTFTRIGPLSAPNDTFNIRDIAFDPANPNIMIANLVAGNGGIYRTTDALAPAPTWTNVLLFPAVGTTNGLTAEFASHHPAGAPDAVFYTLTGFDPTPSGSSRGRVLRSTNGGVTWTEREDQNFCGGQCFYNLAINVVPVDTNPDNDRVYIGGQTNPIFAFSTNGGDTFANSQQNLHADTHVIAVAPSNSSIIYHGNDGGIFKSINAGATWTELNNNQFSATQFISLDVHPTDPNFSIGGTQDNGTNLRDGSGSWSHADDGDGGFTVIDQNATDTVNVRMYHTFFNQTNAMGYGRVLTSATAVPGGWTYFGCGFGGFLPNGMTCTATATLFYAPMERGPGSPFNTLYFGSDVLYRSADGGTTMTKVSQEPIQSGVAISAIGIAPQNDDVRIVGLSNGGIWGTGTTPGSTTLQDLDPSNVVPNIFVGRVAIDPTDVNTAYVTLSAYNVVSIWKTTTLSSLGADGVSVAPTWVPANNGLPQVPVNAFVIDPLNTFRLYAGTDIGVYTSGDGGQNWIPFAGNLPRIAVFDMQITPNRKLRVATHGRGLWETDALAPTAAQVNISGRVTANGYGVPRATVKLIDNAGATREVITNSFGYYHFDEVAVGQNYTLEATSKRHQFQPQVIFVESDMDGVNFDSVEAGGRTSR